MRIYWLAFLAGCSFNFGNPLEQCTAESDAAFCAQMAGCGSVTAVDNCGDRRTADCACAPGCGNGTVESGETCDGDCPASCDDGNACTADTASGNPAKCNVSCGHEAVSRCLGGDGCCPAGCGPGNDNDCSKSCGNGAVESGETCDGDCPTSCSDGNACTADSLTGSVANCNAACVHQAVSQCQNGDGCCPAGCNYNNDDDCSKSCGNGVVESGESCDGNCPASCGDGNACTIDGLLGSATNCNAACVHQPISQCQSGDGCCPAGCNHNSDSDCSASCGNSVVESGETCDNNCPFSCGDGNACTIDTLVGSAANCNVACVHQPIAQCQSGDGCCPAGCNHNSDSDCSSSCGNSVVESGETCDGNCPASCDDGNACTVEIRTGSAANCNVTCGYQWIVQCKGGDGCCPLGCLAASDGDCAVVCGNGIVEMGESCDGNCPASCNDGDPCTADTMMGSGCSVVCQHVYSAVLCPIQGWARTYGTDKTEEANAMAALADRGVFQGGTVNADSTLAGWEPWLMRLSPGGDILWQKVLRDASFNHGTTQAVKELAGGDLLAVVSVTYLQDPANPVDGTLVVRLSPEGALRWTRFLKPATAGTTSYVPSALELADYSIVLGGVADTPSFQRVWLTRLTASGNILWSKTYAAEGGRSAIVRTDTLAASPDGGFVAVATHYPDVASNETNMWVLKLTASGGVTWQKHYLTPDYVRLTLTPRAAGGYQLNGGMGPLSGLQVALDEGGSVVSSDTWDLSNPTVNLLAHYGRRTADGGMFLVGVAQDKVTSEIDTSIVKLDAGGNVSWQKLLGGAAGSDFPRALLQGPDGAFVLGFYTASFGAGATDSWIVKLDGNGQIAGCPPTVMREGDTVVSAKYSLAVTVTTTASTVADFDVTALSLPVTAVASGVGMITQCSQ